MVRRRISTCRIGASRAAPAAFSTTISSRAIGKGLRLHPRRGQRVSGHLSHSSCAADMDEPWSERPSANEQLVQARALCGIQPALRPRHAIRAEDRRQYRGYPDVPAARGRMALMRQPPGGLFRFPAKSVVAGPGHYHRPHHGRRQCRGHRHGGGRVAADQRRQGHLLGPGRGRGAAHCAGGSPPNRWPSSG